MYDKVWRYIELEKKWNTPNFLSRLQIWAELIIQPLGHILFWICLFAAPSLLTYFGFVDTPTNLKMAMYGFNTIQVLIAMFKGWINVIEYYHLGTLFLCERIKHSRSKINYIIKSSDPSHQLFRYAALNSLL
jgi:hypothetical protein